MKEILNVADHPLDRIATLLEIDSNVSNVFDGLVILHDRVPREEYIRVEVAFVEQLPMIHSSDCGRHNYLETPMQARCA